MSSPYESSLSKPQISSTSNQFKLKRVGVPGSGLYLGLTLAGTTLFVELLIGPGLLLLWLTMTGADPDHGTELFEIIITELFAPCFWKASSNLNVLVASRIVDLRRHHSSTTFVASSSLPDDHQNSNREVHSGLRTAFTECPAFWWERFARLPTTLLQVSQVESPWN